MIGSGSRGCFSSLLHDHRRFEFAFEHLPFEFRGRRGSNLSKFSSVTGAFLRRREFRSRLKNNSAGLARAGSVLVDFTATAHLDRSIDRDARIFAFPLSLSFSFGEPTATMVIFIFHSFTDLADESRVISFVPRFSTNRNARPMNLTRESTA